MTKVIKIYGSPGTGKTTYLLNQLEMLLASGYSLDEICFISFTKAAVRETKQRMLDKGYDENRLHGFKTLHALCYRLLNLSDDNVLNAAKYKSFAKECGIPVAIADSADMEENPLTFTSTSYTNELMQFISVNDYMRNACIDTIPMIHNMDLSKFIYLREKLAAYRAVNNYFDFTSFIEQAISRKIKLPYKIIMIDEVQDLTKLQIRLIDMWIAQDNVDACWLCGDDAQAIYTFAGADARLFLDHEGNDICLVDSWRLPQRVLNYSRGIFDKIKVRKDRELLSKNNENGIVNYMNSLDGAQLKNKNVFILHRHRFGCQAIAAQLQSAGIAFTNKRGYSPFECNEYNAYKAIHQYRQDKAFTILGLQAILKLTAVNVKYMKRGLKNMMMKVPFCLDMYDADKLLSIGFTPEFITGLALNPLDVMNKAAIDRWIYFEKVSQMNDIMVKPQIAVSTIHGVKGNEADYVILFDEISHNTQLSMYADSDQEHRVFYVGATRAKKELHIVRTFSEFTYPLSI